MMVILFTTILTYVTAQDQEIKSDLRGLCPRETDDDGNTQDTFNTWNEVPSNQWYWGNDWDEFLANGTSPFASDGDGNVYPAGFRNYQLAHYSEPPICMFVPGSRDKKVEILMESPLENANLCLRDAGYDGVGTNNVGNIDNCGSGKIYACFTAATTENQNLGFYVACESGCEDMALDVWIRVRVSQQSWSQGKTNSTDDLEHWCEGERGTHVDGDDLDSPLYYTYPSDLIPDEPSEYPFHIRYIFGRNAGGMERPSLWISMLLTVVGVAVMLA